MIEQIKRLEQIARQLDPDENQRALLLDKVNHYANTFLNQLTSAPAFVHSEANGRGLLDAPISEAGIPIEEALTLIQACVDRPGLNPASGRFLGYIPGGGLYHSALGDFLAAITNKYAGIFYPAPGAVRMENMLLNWMAGIIGYPDTATGNLTSGGSIAHLIGIVTARDAHQIEAERVKTAVVYMTEQIHHSVEKALRVAGLRACVKRFIAVDEGYRMNADALEAAVRADRQAGLTPWLIIASAGTTNTGAIDPLPVLAQLAQAHNLWLHVDGAYGAFFALCEEGERKLAGMEQSDSIIIDPHKTLFLPYGTGAVLVKDTQKLIHSFQAHADYMQDTLQALDEISPTDVSPELTKHFRGLRLWLPLKLLGVAPFRAALAEKLLLTQYFHHKIQEVEGFNVGPYPDLAVSTFWYVPQRGDANAFNERLAHEIQRDGRIFISTTKLGRQFVLRIAVGVHRTHLDDIEQTLAILSEKAKQLEADG